MKNNLKINKIIKKIDKNYTIIKFNKFQKDINNETINNIYIIRKWADKCLLNVKNKEEMLYNNHLDRVSKQGIRLANESKIKFKNKYENYENLRILIHVPSIEVSPGGFSLFNNIIEGLNFIGINARALNWDDKVDIILQKFKPTVLLTSDNKPYLDKIDWDVVNEFKKKNLLRVGLTASLEEYGNTPLKERLSWAKINDVDFYYSFRAQEYLLERKEYRPFYKNGYKIYTIEFGANPIYYYPIPSKEKDIDYVFLGSANFDKLKRYMSYFNKIFKNSTGYIDGPGWKFSNEFIFNPNRDRYIYSRAKVGLNLHVDSQIQWASELNERTYMLAACGVPQLIDNPKLLQYRFSDKCFFVSNSSEEYMENFNFIINNPEKAELRALQAQKEVFEKHTIFHRAESFINKLIKIL